MTSLTSSRTIVFFDDNFGTGDDEWNPPKLDARDKYVAAVVSNGREKVLGQFDTPEEAYQAYIAQRGAA